MNVRYANRFGKRSSYVALCSASTEPSNHRSLIEHRPPDMRDPAVQDSEHILGLEKGLAIIGAFGAGHPRLTLAEAARRTGLSRAAARRCLLTLEKLGYAEHDGKFFSLTPRVLRLAQAYLASNPVPGALQPVIESLRERTQESASATILDGTDVVFVARSITRRALVLGVGGRLPGHCAAAGRVLLSSYPDDKVKRMLLAMERRALTPKTVTEISALMEEVRRVRGQGYAISDEELALGLRSIAVPVRNSAGLVVAAMTLSARTARNIMIDKLLPALEAGQRALYFAL